MAKKARNKKNATRRPSADGPPISDGTDSHAATATAEPVHPNTEASEAEQPNPINPIKPIKPIADPRQVAIQVPVISPFALNMSGQAVCHGNEHTKTGGDNINSTFAGRPLSAKQIIGLAHLRKGLVAVGAEGGALVESAGTRGRREVDSDVNAVLWMLEQIADAATA